MDPCENIHVLHVGDPVAAGTHFVSALVAACAILPMLRKSAGDPIRRATSIVYVASMVLLFTASTAYHVAIDEPQKSALRRFDHASIYVLIAGTYTPIVGNLLRGFARRSILALIWIVALAGIVLKTFFFGITPEWVDVDLYLAMGWFGIVPTALILPVQGVRVAWIMSGALLYTAGALSELFGWPVIWKGVFGFHEVFHVAVMAACTCFYVFIARHAMEAPPAPAALGGLEPFAA